MNRIDRLSAILVMLQSFPCVKAKDISHRFDISTRTVYRDIKALESTGIPISGDAGIGYSLVEGFKLPPLMFTQEEAFAFLVAEKLIAQFTDFDFNKSYQSGTDKIKAVMKMGEKKSIESLSKKIDTLDFKIYNKNTSSHNFLKQVLKAVSKQKRIQISYSDYKQQLSKRKIDPIGIFFSMTNWYLMAFCHTKNDYRCFRTDRIKAVWQTDEEFEKKHPLLNSFLESMRDQEKLKKVIIEVDKKSLLTIGESKFYQGLVREEEKGGKVRLHFMSYSLDNFSRWYLSFIDIAHIVYPRSLKTKITELVNKAGYIPHPTRKN